MIDAIETLLYFTPQRLFVVSVEDPYTSEKIGYPILPEAGSRFISSCLTNGFEYAMRSTAILNLSLPSCHKGHRCWPLREPGRIAAFFITESGERERTSPYLIAGEVLNRSAPRKALLKLGAKELSLLSYRKHSKMPLSSLVGLAYSTSGSTRFA